MTLLKRKIVIFYAILMLLVAFVAETEQATLPPASYEDNSSSAEETEPSIENSEEVVQSRLKRATDFNTADTNNVGANPRAAIPGLPDPATIIKIGELLQTLSDQVVPIIVEGISAPAEFVTQQLNKDFQLIKKFKNKLDLLSEQFRVL